MPTAGPTSGQAAGAGGDQARHRRHREGQVADEEGVIEGWANEHRRPPRMWIDVGSRADQDRHRVGSREVIRRSKRYEPGR
jgi:hypothetical protein